MAKQSKQANKNTKQMALLIAFKKSDNEYMYTFTKELLEYNDTKKKEKKITKN